MSKGISRITVNRTELGNALAFAQMGQAKRPVVPVLAGIMVTVSSGTLELAAFDYETSARAKVSGEASGPGSILANGGELAAAVKSLPKGKRVQAEISITDEALVITCDGTESVVSGMGEKAASEYPGLPSMPDLSGYLDAEIFARSVRRVTACAGTDDTLPVLLCVKVTSEHGSLELAATDRYRLGVDSLHWTGPDGIAATIPAVTLAKFAAKMGKSGKVAMHFGETFAGFSDGVYSLTVRTTTGDFPKYHALMPTEHDALVTVDAAKLAAAVKRAGTIGERNSAAGFNVSDTGITVTAEAGGKVASSPVVPAAFGGPAFDAGFDPAYLAPVLSGFAGEVRIAVKLTTQQTAPDESGQRRDYLTVTRPALLTADGDTFTAVIMPVRRPS